MPSSLEIVVRVRRLLLLLVLGEAGGLLVELVLLKHYDDAWQWTPLVLLVAALATGVAVWMRPRSGGMLKAFGVAMGLCVMGGLIGLVLHYRGNMEWALERDPSLGGVPLVWKVLRGATPALAPGAITQLGLLGLIYLYRHPVLALDPHLTPETV